MHSSMESYYGALVGPWSVFATYGPGPSFIFRRIITRAEMMQIITELNWRFDPEEQGQWTLESIEGGGIMFIPAHHWNEHAHKSIHLGMWSCTMHPTGLAYPYIDGSEAETWGNDLTIFQQGGALITTFLIAIHGATRWTAWQLDQIVDVFAAHDIVSTCDLEAILAGANHVHETTPDHRMQSALLALYAQMADGYDGSVGPAQSPHMGV